MPIRRRLHLAFVGASALAARPGLAQLPRLELVVEIGCETCDGPAQFGSILDLSVDPSGEVLVTAGEAPMLRRFDRNGRPVWAGAARGNGPGELQRPMRGMLGPGLTQVVDLSQRRVTRLDSTGRYRSSAPLRGFPAAVAAQGRTGAFVVLLDDFRGGLRLERWTPADSGPASVTLPPAPESPAPGTIVFPALAASPEGEIALARDINTYRIEVLGPDGSERRVLTRDVLRVRRTAAEREALDRITARAAARVGAERGRTGPPPGVAPRPGGDPDLKPHIMIDGLRYDDGGRLWVRTMRGDESVTVFDLFSPAGAFLGEVRIPAAVGRFALAGQWLALSAETEVGYPVVRLYTVR